MAYGDPTDVIPLAGVKPKDLGLATEAALTTLVEARLAEITDWINQETRRDFEQEVIDGELAAVPIGIEGYANQICRNVVASAVASRQTPIVRVDNWRVQIADPTIVSKEILAGLRRYRKRLPIGILRVRSQAEIDAEEAGAS